MAHARQREECLLQDLMAAEDSMDSIHHAHDLATFWDQILHQVEQLSDAFLDKAVYLDEVDRGLCRSRLLVAHAWDRHHSVSDQE